MVGEIGECVEGESVGGIVSIGVVVVLRDKGIVVLEHTEPVAFFFLGRIGFGVFLAPPFEQIGGVGGRGERQEESEEEDERQQQFHRTFRGKSELTTLSLSWNS